MTRFRLIVPAILCAGLGLGCASSVKKPPEQAAAEIRQWDEMVKGLAEQTDRNSAWIRTAGNELAAIRERLETLQSRADSALATEKISMSGIQEDVQALAARVERLENPVTEIKLIDRKPTAKAPGAFRPAGYNVEAAYNDALTLYRARKYEPAIGAFTEIMTVSPSSSLADNAQYWIGESYYAMRNYEKSLQAFTKVTAFPKSNKAADAHLKIAMIYQVMENRNAAVEELKIVVRDYPSSEAARIATAKLQAFGR